MCLYLCRCVCAVFVVHKFILFRSFWSSATWNVFVHWNINHLVEKFRRTKMHLVYRNQPQTALGIQSTMETWWACSMKTYLYQMHVPRFLYLIFSPKFFGGSNRSDSKLQRDYKIQNTKKERVLHRKLKAVKQKVFSLLSWTERTVNKVIRKCAGNKRHKESMMWAGAWVGEVEWAQS